MRSPLFSAIAIAALFTSPVLFAQETGGMDPAPEDESVDAAAGEQAPSDAPADMEQAPMSEPIDEIGIPMPMGPRNVKGAGIGWTFDLGGGDYATLKINGQFRARGEVRKPNLHGSAAGDRGDSRGLMRSRLSFELNLPSDTNFMLQFQDSRVAGEEGSGGANKGAGIDALQAHFFTHNLFDTGMSAYIGRQRFNIGDQRLWSVLDFSNTGRAWDGIRLECQDCGAFNWRLFWMNLSDDLSATRSENHAFGATLGWKTDSYEGELFGLYQTMDAPVESQVLTGSLRVKGSIGDLNYGAEGVAQIGETEEYGLTDSGENYDVFAYAAGVKFDYTVWGDPGLAASDQYVIMAGWDFASGGTLSDDEANTFKSPFILGHGYNGEADIIGYRNIHDVYGGVTWKPADWYIASAGVVFHSFFRHNNSDGVYNTAGTMIRGGDLDDRKHVGNEVDAIITAKFGKYTTLKVVYSHFFKGPFWEDRAERGDGIDDDIDVAYASLTVNF